LSRPDEKLDGGAHQGALAIFCKAILTIADADPAATFWESIPDETRPEAIDIINEAATKLAGLSAAGQLDRIVRAAPGRRP
jgi:hypothetical protein